MIKKIALKTPCDESWDDMKPAADGRFCLSCQKSVVDFSGMTNDEILVFLAGKKNLCGRIGQDQLESINYLLQHNRRAAISWRKFGWAAAMLSMAPFVKTQAKPFVKTEQGPLRQKKEKLTADTAKRKLSGIIIGSDDRLPVIGARIRVKGGDIEVFTAIDGKFSIEVPKECDTLEFGYIGYAPQVAAAKRFVHGGNQIALKTIDTVVLRPMMTGGFMVGSSFFQRVWWRIRWQIVTIFRRRHY